MSLSIGVRIYGLLYLDNRGYILKKLREEAVKMFMVLMFTLLPLYYSDNYYNILNDKRDIYWLFSRILFVVIAVSLCISLMLVIKKPSIFKKYVDTT